MSMPVSSSGSPAVQELAARPFRTVRPQDAADLWAFPIPELARLHRTGTAHRMARGYYMIVPSEHARDDHWKPDLQVAAAAIASSIYGPEDYMLMGVSAAHLYGAVSAPRVAVAAVPRQHTPILFTDRPKSRVWFVQRRRPAAVTVVASELGDMRVTSREQTLVDLVVRPQACRVDFDDVGPAIRGMWERCDRRRLRELAAEQKQERAISDARRRYNL